jgi:hypothetical protein
MNISTKLSDSKMPFIIEIITYITLLICVFLSPTVMSLLHPIEYQNLPLLDLLDNRFMMVIIFLFSYFYLAILSTCLLLLLIAEYFQSTKSHSS